LPIGTPLGQTGSRQKNDRQAQQAYDSFMSASTPADQRRAAGWMSTDDLSRAAEALFSFDSKNPRDEAARIALVRELADRGIDPHRLGYRGGPIVLNPNPKQDPTVKAAEKIRIALRSDQKKATREAEKAKREAEQAARQKIKDEAAAADLSFRKQAGEALAQGVITDREIQERWRNRRNPQPTG
jgi:hypothetical protein